ncbi:ADP-ribosylglycohydrolase family protein [Garciella nitratireducens]|uniref:ADP-ribosylglycohydrolase family protein n=1 Tax=Garciella nitratireducens TaxID=218205 RepID=UPI000DE984A9|nr:ADP-ribosylglycohydrolase family protein [Garciella nitratireducens]RBP44958.1 ADP-ribosylglycohydrolase [Garciella nitratireducens]
MLGAIAGDIIGSVYEWNNTKTENFKLFHPSCRFTDDTVLTIAIADAILSQEETDKENNDSKIYAQKLKQYGKKYPLAGYGGKFKQWLNSDSFEPYYSFGNGSAMRVSPIGFAFDHLDKVLEESKKSAEVTHNHPEGIKGAQAVASAIFLARMGKNKEEIKQFIQEKFKYSLEKSLEEIRPSYTFDASCQGSVPQAILAFLESNSYEDTIRKAISIGGDSDTIACIAGGIAQAYYKKIPEYIIKKTLSILDAELVQVIDNFYHKYDLEIYDK